MDLDIWRFVSSGRGIASRHRGHLLLEKDELARLKFLPGNWWYHLNQDGDGVAIDFPLKVKPILSWSPKTFVKRNGSLVEARRFPIEKVCLTVIRKACTAENL